MPAMSPPRLAAVLCLTAALAAGGCGSSDDDGQAEGTKAFEAKGIDITFDYPEEMKKSSEVELGETVGAKAKVTAGVGFDKRNAIIVQRFDLKREINEGDLEAVKPEVDRLLEQALTKFADGQPTEVGGLPALQYEFEVQGRPGERSRLLVIFDGDVEYTINCQSNEKRREEMDKACRTALDSVETKT